MVSNPSKEPKRRRRHLELDTLPGRLFEEAGKTNHDDEVDGADEDGSSEKESRLVDLVKGWIPFVSQRASQKVSAVSQKLGIVKKRLFPPKACADE